MGPLACAEYAVALELLHCVARCSSSLLKTATTSGTTCPAVDCLPGHACLPAAGAAAAAHVGGRAGGSSAGCGPEAGALGGRGKHRRLPLPAAGSNTASCVVRTLFACRCRCLCRRTATAAWACSRLRLGSAVGASAAASAATDSAHLSDRERHIRTLTFTTRRGRRDRRADANVHGPTRRSVVVVIFSSW